MQFTYPRCGNLLFTTKGPRSARICVSSHSSLPTAAIGIGILHNNQLFRCSRLLSGAADRLLVASGPCLWRGSLLIRPCQQRQTQAPRKTTSLYVWSAGKNGDQALVWEEIQPCFYCSYCFISTVCYFIMLLTCKVCIFWANQCTT